MTIDEYLGLITVQHRDKPKFISSLSVNLAQAKTAFDSLEKIAATYDLDTAIGKQLDDIGIWIGRSRYVDTPIQGAYFTWAGAATVGWGSGVWKDMFDPSTGLTKLPDDSYRLLLKAKIAANNWDGSIPGAYQVWDGAFGGTPQLLIQDNQDMTMMIGIVGPPMSAVTKALITGGYLPLKPAGVRVSYSVSPDGGPLMAWGLDNGSTLSGWGTGRWGDRL